jgi:outer membrane protein assembly factor BamB
MKIFVGVLITLAVVIAIFALVRFGLTGQEGEEFVYDVSKLAKIDPNLILYEESGQPISTCFTNSRGIAVDSKGSLYVAGDKAIRVFGEDGNLISEIKLTDMPRCLTAADDGKIYIGMKNHIEVYDSEGKKLAGWQPFGNETVLTSIAVSKGDVFIADAGKRIVLCCDTAGSLINYIGRKDENKNIPGFVIPSPYFDLAVASDGLLRVVNPGRHRIEAYTVDGDLEFSWGEFSSDLKGFCGCCNPVNFAILEDGSFVTCEKGIIRVKIYDPAGNFVGVVAGPEQLLTEGAAHVCETAAECQTGGFDVAAGLRGQVFVLDTIKNVVRTFTRKKAG